LLRFEVDHESAPGQPDYALVEDVLADYEAAKKQEHERGAFGSLGELWTDFMAVKAQALTPEAIHHFRRNRLALGHLNGTVALDEDISLKTTGAEGQRLFAKFIMRQEWGSNAERQCAYRHVHDWHRIGREVDPGLLASFEDNRVGGPITVVHQGRRLTRHVVYSAYQCTVLLRWSGLHPSRPALVCDIGAGYGRLARHFTRIFPRATYLLLDLPESVALASFFLKSSMPGTRIGTIRDFEPDAPIAPDALAGYACVALPWWYIENLVDESVDLFINISSMGEMSHAFIEYYMAQIHRLARGSFYWVNRLVGNPRGNRIPFSAYPFDDRWRTVYVRDADRSPLGLHEWLGARCR
jgi:putative sugar O-methyltransferase